MKKTKHISSIALGIGVSFAPAVAIVCGSWIAFGGIICAYIGIGYTFGNKGADATQ